jgi:hypothetical protein
VCILGRRTWIHPCHSPALVFACRRRTLLDRSRCGEVEACIKKDEDTVELRVGHCLPLFRRRARRRSGGGLLEEEKGIHHEHVRRDEREAGPSAACMQDRCCCALSRGAGGGGEGFAAHVPEEKQEQAGRSLLAADLSPSVGRLGATTNTAQQVWRRLVVRSRPHGPLQGRRTGVRRLAQVCRGQREGAARQVPRPPPPPPPPLSSFSLQNLSSTFPLSLCSIPHLSLPAGQH